MIIDCHGHYAHTRVHCALADAHQVTPLVRIPANGAEKSQWLAKQVVATCKKHDVVVGHPHVEAGNAERLIDEGFRFLMCAPTAGSGHLDKAKALVAGTK